MEKEINRSYTYLNQRSKRTDELRKHDTEELCEHHCEQLESGLSESSGSSPKPSRINHQNQYTTAQTIELGISDKS